MAKKKTYYDYLREEMGELVEQLQLPDLYKKSLKRRWLDQVVWADKKADQCRRWHYRLRLTTIVGGIILPALVGINLQLAKDNPFFRTWFPYVPFALSQVIAVSAALEEFYRNGDRWRTYRKMSEDLKAEGWQYLQTTGPYETLENHLDGYAMFASRVESVIKNDVQSYITALQQQQSKENQQVQQILKAANAVSNDKTLFAQPEPVYEAPQPPAHRPAAPAAPQVFHAPAGAAGSLKIRQETELKLSTQMAQSLPDHQKAKVSSGSTFGLLAYLLAENNHFRVTLTQGLGAENHNTWYVYAPHVEMIDSHGQPVPVTAPAAPMNGVVSAAPVATLPVAPAVSTGAIVLPVPYFSQLDNKENPLVTCNTSSCAMVAKFLDAKISGDDEYYQYVIKYGKSTDHNAQTEALTELHIQSTWHVDLDFDDLDKSLASGLPIVIGILHHGSLEAPTGDGHIIVVIGRTASGDYIINDPYGDLTTDYSSDKGEKVTYSRHVLTCRWMLNKNKNGWGRLFYNNHTPSAPAPVAQPAANAGIPVFSVQSSPSTLPATPTFITADQLIQIAGSDAPADRLRQLAPGFNKTLEQYQINRPLRIAHFVAQVAHESACFHAMEEYATGDDYENYAKIGNTQPGDGRRFKGRGLIQLTGRDNYTKFSKAIGKDFVAQPELVAQAPYAVLAAGWFWDANQINSLADQDNLEEVTRTVNGGLTHLEERRGFLQAAKKVLGC